MRALVLVVVSVGLLDCLNPSTIGPALYLATRKDAERSIGGFILGVFAVNIVGGVVLTLGPGRWLIRLLPHPGHATVSRLELAGGVALIVLAVALWLARERVAKHLQRHERRVGGSSILLGAGIMAVELPTAVPYFAVIATIADSAQSSAAQVALLVLFNVVFVAPLLLILAVVGLAGERGARRLEGIHARLHRHAAVLIPAGVLAVGVVLGLLGVVGLA
jgi:cytochrome c biogenesis protein CcdA